MEPTKTPHKKIHNGTVVSNQRIRGSYRRITLELDTDGGSAFGNIQPGQFAQFDLSQTALPADEDIAEQMRDASKRLILLRRPFSFSNVTQKGDGGVLLEVLYCVVGPATVRMSGLRQGRQVSILGPLGNGFHVPEGIKRAILVAGGMGAPPMIHLAGFLKSRYPQIELMVMAGARSFDDFPFTARKADNGEIAIEEFEAIGSPCRVATDDGSAGFKGFVSVMMERWLGENQKFRDDSVIFACGPEAMLAATADAAKRFNIPCHVSMERMMACGIGLCQSCAVEHKSGREGEYKLCCKDGPVFDAEKVKFLRHPDDGQV